jgi:fucose permease
MTLSHSLGLLLASALVVGLGNGAVVAGLNVLVAEVFAARSASALNLLNVFFGVGAVAGPALAGLALRAWGTPLPPLWAGAGLMLLAAPLVPLLAVAPRQTARGSGVAAPVYRAPLLWALGLLILIYVGAEVGIGGWAATYLERASTLSAADAALAASSFWLALTGGRMIATLLGARMTPQALLLCSVGGAAIGGLLLALSVGNTPLTLGALLILGLCLGPIYPTAFSITTGAFAHAPGMAASAFMAMGSVGGALLPWVQGVVLARGGPTASAVLVAGATLAMLGFCVAAMVLPRYAGVRQMPSAAPTDECA